MAENEIHDRIQKLLAAIGNGLYEKDEALRLGLLTAIANESMFMLGAPGCAKSMVARRIKEAFQADGKGEVKYFETLLNEFTTPEEIFGNISLKALNGELAETKGKEEYRRLTDGMLPEADIAFLDEIWKASPAILNTLLTIVNERIFHNGSKVMDVPLKAIFAASNELPAKNQGLEALYDRFVFRIYVSFIQNEESFFQMIGSPSGEKFKMPDDAKPITNEELENWKQKIDEVTLSEETKNVISAVRKELALQNEKIEQDDEKFQTGDRRWKKIVHVLKASAFLNGRSETDLMDSSLMENCIWSTEEQRKKAGEIVSKCLKENGIDCDAAINDVNEAIEEFKQKNYFGMV